MSSWSTRLEDFLALDEDWVRPGAAVTRGDVLLTVITVLLSLFVLALMRSIGSLAEVEDPVWQQWLLTAAPGLLLLVRRRWPLVTASLGSLMYWAIGTWSPMMSSLLSTQVVYLMLIFAGVAWARNRRALVAVYALILAAMFFWLVWGLGVGNVVSDMVTDTDPDALIPSSVAAPLMLGVINILYFGGGVIGGQVAWLGARQRARLEEQAATITEQSDRLREQAVVQERLRIARDLHDVVAHHVSGLGVQASAARRVMERDPEAAKGALTRIEEGSREAVSQMRGLLGTLRMGGAGGEDHGAQPGLEDVASLTGGRPGLEVLHEMVEAAPGDLAAVPDAAGHSLYRTAQEALTNVARHSTAHTARVIVRVDAAHAEVEVTDDGRPRQGTSGTGMGQLGIRERVASHHGTVEIGPRPMGGYRVRARIPLRAEARA